METLAGARFLETRNWRLETRPSRGRYLGVRGSEKVEKLGRGQVGGVEDGGECSRGQRPMRGNNHLSIRVVAHENHVAAALAMEAEPSAAKGRNQSLVGKLAR